MTAKIATVVKRDMATYTELFDIVIEDRGLGVLAVFRQCLGRLMSVVAATVRARCVCGGFTFEPEL